MCLQWCHVTNQVVDNDYPCLHCPPGIRLAQREHSCSTCQHREGAGCQLTGQRLPLAQSCCHHNARRRNPAALLLLTTRNVHPAQLALHGVGNLEALFWAVESAPEPEVIQANELVVRLADLAVPWVYGLPAEAWPGQFPRQAIGENLPLRPPLTRQTILVRENIPLPSHFGGLMSSTLEWIEISDIRFSSGNPRSDAGEDLEGLAASLGAEPEQSNLVSPPLVMRAESGYLLVAGERRVRAAQQAGWTRLQCQVRDDLNARQAHRLRVVENLHRRALNPLDEAAALRLTWLAANAEALGLGEAVERLLAHPTLTQNDLLRSLEELLDSADFHPTHPAVSWEGVLDELGVELKPENRKKLLRVLSLAPEVQEMVRPLGLTSAALRSIGAMEPEQQAQLAQELTQNPDLARKTRRIARVVREGSYSLEEAIAEAKGQVSPLLDEDETGMAAEPGENSAEEDARASEQVIQLLEAATQARQAVDNLTQLLGPDFLGQLSPAWRDYAQEALEILNGLQGEEGQPHVL